VGRTPNHDVRGVWRDVRPHGVCPASEQRMQPAAARDRAGGRRLKTSVETPCGCAERRRSQFNALAKLVKDPRGARPRGSAIQARRLICPGTLRASARPSPLRASAQAALALRLSAQACAARLSARPSSARAWPVRLVSPRNVLLFYGGGNHARTCGLPGGAEGIRTDGHRGLVGSNRGISLANIKVARDQTASANHESLFSRKPQISLAFCPSKSNGRDCSRALRRLQDRPADEMIGEFFGPARLVSGPGARGWPADMIAPQLQDSTMVRVVKGSAAEAIKPSPTSRIRASLASVQAS
jgi:hypothetical protein